MRDRCQCCAAAPGPKARALSGVAARRSSPPPPALPLPQVTFKLHNTFANPNRDLAYPPYELTESGWGEFDIGIELHFHDDAGEPPLELYHHLQLGLDAQGNPQKKPHVYEVYEEAVFWEPTEAFYERVKNHVPAAAPASAIANFFGKFDPAMDCMRVQNARKRLAPVSAQIKAQLAALDAEEGGGGGEAAPAAEAAAPMEQG